MKNNNRLIKILSIIVTVLTPLVILMLSIRVLLTPSFVRLAYRLPGFPDDPYGFSTQDRLRWSDPSVKYLVNREDITFLSDLTFENGEPIYNARELSHMEDVKAVVTGMRIALAISVVILLVITIIALRQGWKLRLISAFHWGGWALFGLIAAILLFVALSFNTLFTVFHRIFFENGTWQFYTSDTLIRLYPMRFWRDAFITVGLVSVILGGVLTWFTRRPKPSEM